MNRKGMPMVEPPEGVTSGENVGMGSEPDEIKRANLDMVVSLLKEKGEPYVSMSESKLEDKAVEILEEKR